MPVTIECAGLFVGNERVSCPGVSGWDYLDAEPPYAFASETEARAWIEAHYLGADDGGMKARFELVTVT